MSGRRLGLDYAAIAPTASLLDIPTSAGLMHEIRVMEIEALDTMAARQ